jgi:5-methylcytosine-specific restriction endonuclease McrA
MIGICSICQQEKKLPYIGNIGRLCRACYAKHRQPSRMCQNCGKQTIIQANNLCSVCYTEKNWRFIVCSSCGKTRHPICVDSNLCRTCYRKGLFGVCAICGNKKILVLFKRRICASCYSNIIQPKHMCSQCGKIAKVLERNGINVLCRRCWNALPERRAKTFAERSKRRSFLDEDLLPVQEWLYLMKSTDWTCFYCGRSIGGRHSTIRTMDHIVPVSKGGVTTISNLVPCCRSCNSSKSNAMVDVWLYKHPEIMGTMDNKHLSALGICQEVAHGNIAPRL